MTVPFFSDDIIMQEFVWYVENGGRAGLMLLKGMEKMAKAMGVVKLIVVDYLDLMNPNQKVDMNDVFTKDKLSTEQLRDILFDYNAIGATASQLNRDSIKAAEHDQSHIAGGISKLNTVDWALSIIWNPKMKAAGEIGMCFLKAVDVKTD